MLLTYFSQMIHLTSGNWIIFVLDYGFSPDRHQTII